MKEINAEIKSISTSEGMRLKSSYTVALKTYEDDNKNLLYKVIIVCDGRLGKCTDFITNKEDAIKLFNEWTEIKK